MPILDVNPTPGAVGCSVASASAVATRRADGMIFSCGYTMQQQLTHIKERPLHGDHLCQYCPVFARSEAAT